jgi:hypothetical protein
MGWIQLVDGFLDCILVSQDETEAIYQHSFGWRSWRSIYQLFGCEQGTRVLTHSHITGQAWATNEQLPWLEMAGIPKKQVIFWESWSFYGIILWDYDGISPTWHKWHWLYLALPYALNPDLGCWPDLFLRTPLCSLGTFGDCGDCLSVDHCGS